MRSATHSELDSTQGMALLLGRLLMAALFIVAGVRKAMAFSASAGYMVKNGVPMAEFLLVLTLVLEIGGGLMLVLGWKTRWISLVLAIFVAVITPIFHGFWAFDGAQFTPQLNNFLKNIAIVGGLLYFAVFGAGRLSLDSR